MDLTAVRSNVAKCAKCNNPVHQIHQQSVTTPGRLRATDLTRSRDLRRVTWSTRLSPKYSWRWCPSDGNVTNSKTIGSAAGP